MIIIILNLVIITELLLWDKALELDPNSGTYMLITSAVLLFILLLFYQLETQVTQDAIHIKFGIGLIRKTIPLEEVASTRTVKNSWWYGWGIRLTPYGWLWNIAGYDAVELDFKNTEKSFRIGCKDAEALKAEIDKRM